MFRNLALGVFLLGAATPQSWAWGREGHRLTALVAEHYLTPEARAQAAVLLHANPNSKDLLASIASWADDYRNERPETAPWHFVDIPKDQASYDRMRDCPAQASDPKSPWRDCVTDRILYFEGRLGDTTLSVPERAMALKFIVHLIGDVHQPLHAIGDDRGGNGIQVTFMGSRACGSSKCNLHEVWDSEMIEHEALNEPKYLAKLLEEIKDNQWEKLSGGEPTGWANTSHKYAVNAWAPNGALLTSEYVKEEERVVDSEIALGGLRLARVLNRILTAPDAAEAAPAPVPTVKPDAPK